MGFLNLTKEMTTDSRWRWKSASKAVTTQKPLAFLQDEPRVGGSDTLRHMQRANVSISPRRKWLLLTVMDSGDTPDYLARTHHIRRVPDFWSVTGSPLKKLICQATMSSLGSGVLVQ
jgi:hypothetical protein